MGNRVAIVTGGTRGMGRAISLALAEKGYIVNAIYRSNKACAAETEKELKSLQKDSCVLCGDISNQGLAMELAEAVYRKWGRIDILVNNAGIFDFCYIEDMTEEYLDKVLRGNFKTQFFMIKAVLPYMKQQKYGRIINASSISGHFADCGLVGYGASKAAVDMLTKIGASEFGPYGITVNAYAPGIIHTDMTHEMIMERGNEQLQDICLQRFGAPEEVAALVGFLASEEAGYITGEIIGIDGGMFKVQNAYLAHQHANKK